MNQVKVSEIRAKFPMYGDMSDEQLLGAVRRKFYAEIPMGEFVKRVDFDTERARLNPTNDMNGFETTLAGYGKGGADLARGVGQMLGLVSRDDVAESRKLDAPLMDTVGGKTGAIAGTVVPMLATALIPGVNTMAGSAAVGGATGLLAPSTSTNETLTNTALGGVAGPAAIALGRAGVAAYQGLKGLVQPLTKNGQEQIAAATLRQFARDPKSAAIALQNPQTFVNGSLPTVAQASGDPGLAQLERTLVNNPETGPELAARFAQQRAARLQAIKSIAGTDEHYNAIKRGRSVFANEDYGKAIAQGLDQDMAASMGPQLKELLGRPSIKQAQSVAKSLAAESGDVINDFGSLKGLDYLVKALDNTISKASNPGNSIGKERLRAIVQTKNDLLSVIDDIAPAYKEARENFAGMSKSINSMDVARALQKRYEPALARFGAGGREHANAYATALEGAQESVKRATGLDLPIERVMHPGDVTTLTNVARDLARKAATEDAGRAVGSNTAQNLAAQNLLRRTLGPTGLPQSWSESTMLQTFLAPLSGIYKLGGADKKIMDRLGQASLDPADAAMLLRMPQAQIQQLQGLLDAGRYLPAPTAGLLGQVRQ